MQITHKELVRALAKPGDAIIASLTPMTMHLLHMAIGVAGEAAEFMQAVHKGDRANAVEELGDTEFYMEGIYDKLNMERQLHVGLTAFNDYTFVGAAGDLLDQIKKLAVYNKPVEVTAIGKALDAMERELAGARSLFDISRQECIDHNIAKLSKRYSAGTYSDKAAQERADKA